MGWLNLARRMQEFQLVVNIMNRGINMAQRAARPVAQFGTEACIACARNSRATSSFCSDNCNRGFFNSADAFFIGAKNTHNTAAKTGSEAYRTLRITRASLFSKPVMSA